MQRWVACAPRAFAVALSLVGISSAEAETVGAMKEVVRTVYGTPLEGRQSATRVGDSVLHNETFETWKESRALVEFIDGSHLTLGANSKVVIDEFVFDPAETRGKALINLSVGTLRFVTGQMPHGGVVIKTPTATLTLRGTDVIVHVHPDGTTDTTVQEGRVEAHNNVSGDSTDLGPGDGATVGEGGNQPFAGTAGPDIQGGGNDTGEHRVEHRREGGGPNLGFGGHGATADSSGGSDDGGDDGGCDGGCF
ncbi:MAG TPA: FecR family protein [Dongiaceae bacterium]|nr:FecR family protein [Dongiaceae bacterium]